MQVEERGVETLEQQQEAIKRKLEADDARNKVAELKGAANIFLDDSYFGPRAK